MTDTSTRELVHTIGVGRLAAASGTTAAVIFLLCWLGQFIALDNPTHAYIALFTAAEAKSSAALIQGMLWSLLFATLSGGVFALVYNRLAGLDRRG